MASHLHGKIGQNIFSRKIIIQLLFFRVINAKQEKAVKSDQYRMNWRRERAKRKKRRAGRRKNRRRMRRRCC
jgi:hypothetical protein